jgi:hypothetical protein
LSAAGQIDNANRGHVDSDRYVVELIVATARSARTEVTGTLSLRGWTGRVCEWREAACMRVPASDGDVVARWAGGGVWAVGVARVA